MPENQDLVLGELHRKWLVNNDLADEANNIDKAWERQTMRLSHYWLTQQTSARKHCAMLAKLGQIHKT